ncbi:MAG: hypothetical protein COA46_07470 [Porticoccaceae bacterium]|nr:MAG: hypothetical protein COA46_07470 [Porticoccaceae bacterium]
MTLVVYGHLEKIFENYMYLNCGYTGEQLSPCSEVLYLLDKFVANWLFVISVLLSISLQIYLLYSIQKRNIFNKSKQSGTS